MDWRRMALVGVFIPAVALAAQDKPAANTPTPQDTFQAVNAALQQHDLQTLAKLAMPPHAVTLQGLAEPFAKARQASDRLAKVAQEKLKFPFTHPFAAGLAPFAERSLELVEIAKDGTQLLGRIRYGPPGKAPEETVGIYAVDGIYRVDLPAEIARMAQKLSRPATGDQSSPLEQEKQRLAKVARILDTLAEEIDKGQWTTKETVTLRLLELVEETKLAEGTGE